MEFKKQDYGHRPVNVMLDRNGIALNYVLVMYDKLQPKIQIVCDFTRELPEVPVHLFFPRLCVLMSRIPKLINIYRLRLAALRTICFIPSGVL